MSDYEIRPLGADTWDAFLALCEKHGGVWGGCYCAWFHAPGKVIRELGNREFKRQRVLAGHHAWLEEGIVGLMTDETPAPSGSKGSRATQELRQTERVGVA